MDKKKHNRLLKGLHSKVFDRPLLITQQALNPIVEYMLNPERGLAKEADIDLPPVMADYDSENSYYNDLAEYFDVDLQNKVGHLNISGTLVNRSGQIESCIELVSYESLISKFKSQVDLGIKTCVMWFDSGGGEAYRCFASAKVVRDLADKNGVKLIAYIDGLSASASYAWSCIAHEVVSNAQSSVGSIGVVVQLYNEAEYLKNLGIERSFVYAGDNKIPFDAEGSFTKSFIDSIQSSVDKTYNSFVKHVATNRNISEDSVRATKASVYDAEDALSAGLIDKIMEIEDFTTYINSQPKEPMENSEEDEGGYSNPEKELVNANNNLKLTHLQEGKKMDDLEVIKSKLEKMTESNTAMSSELTSLKASLQEAVVQKEQAESALEKAVLEHKQGERKQVLSVIFGKESDKVAQYATMFANLDDTAFTALATELGSSREKAKVEMKEQGHDKKDAPIELTEQEYLNKQAELRGNRFAKGDK